MTNEEIKNRLAELKQQTLEEGCPQHFAKIRTRQLLMAELREKGFKNSDAVCMIYKAQQELKEVG